METRKSNEAVDKRIKIKEAKRKSSIDALLLDVNLPSNSTPAPLTAVPNKSAPKTNFLAVRPSNTHNTTKITLTRASTLSSLNAGRVTSSSGPPSTTSSSTSVKTSASTSSSPSASASASTSSSSSTSLTEVIPGSPSKGKTTYTTANKELTPAKSTTSPTSPNSPLKFAIHTVPFSNPSSSQTPNSQNKIQSEETDGLGGATGIGIITNLMQGVNSLNNNNNNNSQNLNNNNLNNNPGNGKNIDFSSVVISSEKQNPQKRKVQLRRARTTNSDGENDSDGDISKKGGHSIPDLDEEFDGEFTVKTSSKNSPVTSTNSSKSKLKTSDSSGEIPSSESPKRPSKKKGTGTSPSDTISTTNSVTSAVSSGSGGVTTSKKPRKKPGTTEIQTQSAEDDSKPKKKPKIEEIPTGVTKRDSSKKRRKKEPLSEQLEVSQGTDGQVLPVDEPESPAASAVPRLGHSREKSNFVKVNSPASAPSLPTPQQKQPINAPKVLKLDYFVKDIQLFTLFYQYLSEISEEFENSSDAKNGKLEKSDKTKNSKPVEKSPTEKKLKPQEPTTPPKATGNLLDIFTILIELYNVSHTCYLNVTEYEKEVNEIYQKWFEGKFTAANTHYIGLFTSASLKKLKALFHGVSPNLSQKQTNFLVVDPVTLSFFAGFTPIQQECESILQPYYLHFVQNTPNIVVSPDSQTPSISISPSASPSTSPIGIPLPLPSKLSAEILSSHKILTWNFHLYCKKMLCAEAYCYYIDILNFKNKILQNQQLQQNIIKISEYWLGLGNGNQPRVVFDRHLFHQKRIQAQIDAKEFSREIFDDTLDSMEMSLEEHFIEFTAQVKAQQGTTQPLNSPASARGFDKLKKILS